MQNKSLIFFVFLLMMGLCSSCSLSDSDNNEINYTAYGTITYIELEGGFYGIIGDDSENYDPINLSQDFHEDGLRIWFQFILRDDQISIHQWGTLIEIVSVERLN